jgi:hypothetical protein
VTVSRFVEDALERAGLGTLLAARRRRDFDLVRRTLPEWSVADLLLLGALADEARADDVGDVVRIHAPSPAAGASTAWVDADSDLEVLRAVAVARIAHGGRVGVDWSRYGLELAQVALGFGASDLRGPITRKSGLPILADEALRVKGEGRVDLASIRRREIARLVSHAGRKAVFADDAPPLPVSAPEPAHA